MSLGHLPLPSATRRRNHVDLIRFQARENETYLQHSLPPTRLPPLRQGVSQDEIARHTRDALHGLGTGHARVLEADEIAHGDVAAVAEVGANEDPIALPGQRGQHGGAMGEGLVADIGSDEVAEAENFGD